MMKILAFIIKIYYLCTLEKYILLKLSKLKRFYLVS